MLKGLELRRIDRSPVKYARAFQAGFSPTAHRSPPEWDATLPSCHRVGTHGIALTSLLLRSGESLDCAEPQIRRYPLPFPNQVASIARYLPISFAGSDVIRCDSYGYYYNDTCDDARRLIGTGAKVASEEKNGDQKVIRFAVGVDRISAQCKTYQDKTELTDYRNILIVVLPLPLSFGNALFEWGVVG